MEYRIEVRDKEGNLYKDRNGQKVLRFGHTDKGKGDIIVEAICKELFNQYSAISGSDNINIDVLDWIEISSTYVNYFSFYGREQKFVKLS